MSTGNNTHHTDPVAPHGPKTEAALDAQRKTHTTDENKNSGAREVSDAEVKEVHDEELKGELHTGKHRLVENRVQHDDADKASDKNRLAEDAKRHKHGNPGGKLNGGTTH